MSYSRSLRDAHHPTWSAAVGHRFVDDLLAGTVEDAVLARYLVQDYRFLDGFVAMLGQALASAPALPARLRLGMQLGMVCSEENTYFVDSFDALGVPDIERQAPQVHPATAAFEALMWEAVGTRSYPALLAVLVVAEWLYLDWAERAETEGLAATRPEHVGWVELHRGPGFSSWVRWLRAELDAAEPTDPAERELVASLWARAVACELAFFDAACQG